MTKNNKQAFTLIELLVVVLIIGILAAVAVPQYQVTVLKSRYAAVKNMAKTLAQAEEIYYLANGTYTSDFNKLDVDSPLKIVTNGQLCKLEAAGGYIQCGLFDEDRNPYMYYQVHLLHAVWKPGTQRCVVFSTDLSDNRNKVCKADTGLSSSTGCNTDGCNWEY